ncbi:MAG: glycosyltransferase [Sedimentisphaerales bacterium]
MRVIVAIQERFNITPDGDVYPTSIVDYAFWSRYLKVFDEVVVFARVYPIDEPDAASIPLKASGPGVVFFLLPCYIGPWQYLKCRQKLKRLAKQVLLNEAACILRVPGVIGTLLWYELIRTARPYGLEVVGDPWDSLSPGSVKTVLRPIARRKESWELTRQCRMASVASYVTEHSLQKRYPPGNWSTHYSSIELSAGTIATEEDIKHRLENIDAKALNHGPWRVCYAGSMEQLYKAPDILIKAIVICLARGMKLELVLLGDGRYRPQLENIARKLGISRHVIFLGKVPSGKAVYDQFDMADLYVLPSRQEGLPRSVIEAMARGLPCIGSNVGGFGELLENEYMVQPDDVSALADRIAKVIADPDGLKSAVKRNVEVASQYSSDILEKRRIEFYAKVKEVTQDWLRGKRE